MADNLLDKLDADPGGCRRYVAALYAYGASHEKVAQKLGERFGIRQPSKRIVGEWRRNDMKLVALVDELEVVKRDMAPDASPADVLSAVPAPVDRAEVVSDFFALLDEFPALGELSRRAELDPDFPDDAAMQVLLDGPHDDLEAACRERLGDWSSADVHIALGAAPADIARVERAAAAGTLSEGYGDRTRRRRREAATAS
jgi:hypothetical protein